jgi:hypothetical protein
LHSKPPLDLNIMWIFFVLAFCLSTVSSSVTYVDTLAPGQILSTPVCGSSNHTICSDMRISFHVTSTYPISVYWIDASQLPALKQNPSTFSAYDPRFSCIKSSICNIDQFTTYSPDKVLALLNQNQPTSTVSVQIEAFAPLRTSSARLAPWAIAVIVISILALIGFGSLTLAFFCGIWCFRYRSRSLQTPGVYPVDLHVLPTYHVSSSDF